MNNKNFITLKCLCKIIWNLLDEEVQNYWFCGIGIIGYVDCIIELLGYEEKLLTEEQLDDILCQLY